MNSPALQRLIGSLDATAAAAIGKSVAGPLRRCGVDQNT